MTADNNAVGARTLSLLLRKAAREYLHLSDGDHWDSGLADAQARAVLAAVDTKEAAAKTVVDPAVIELWLDESYVQPEPFEGYNAARVGDLLARLDIQPAAEHAAKVLEDAVNELEGLQFQIGTEPRAVAETMHEKGISSPDFDKGFMRGLNHAKRIVAARAAAVRQEGSSDA